ncbi:MAG: ATP-dependent Clp protease adaptor ClpS [Bacteroidales bacterium]|nr:ATP-dependent Clp protease adaptor ClpS [Bacteroidales bacterium]
MDSNFSSNPNRKGSEQRQTENGGCLVLHNDKVHSFDFVIKALEEVCAHSSDQAEQCAIITHYKGSCEIMKSDATTLREMRLQLIGRGLKVTIE